MSRFTMEVDTCGGWGKYSRHFLKEIADENWVCIVSELIGWRLMDQNVFVSTSCSPDRFFIHNIPFLGLSVFNLRKGIRDATPVNDCVLKTLVGHVYSSMCNGVVHNDLKSDNVCLMDKEGGEKRKRGPDFHVNLIDWGMCKHITVNITDLQSFNNIQYKPPEQTLNETTLDVEKLQVWTLACTIFFMLTGYNITDKPSNTLHYICDLQELSESEFDLRYQVRESPAKVDFMKRARQLGQESKFSPTVIKLLSGMFKINPAKRFTLHQCLNVFGEKVPSFVCQYESKLKENTGVWGTWHVGRFEKLIPRFLKEVYKVMDFKPPPGATASGMVVANMFLARNLFAQSLCNECFLKLLLDCVRVASVFFTTEGSVFGFFHIRGGCSCSFDVGGDLRNKIIQSVDLNHWSIVDHPFHRARLEHWGYVTNNVSGLQKLEVECVWKSRLGWCDGPFQHVKQEIATTEFIDELCQ